MGSEELQRPITESPRRLDEGQPRGLVAGAVLVQSPVALEPANRRLGDVAERAWLGSDRGKPRAPEAALEVANGVAVLARRQ